MNKEEIIRALDAAFWCGVYYAELAYLLHPVMTADQVDTVKRMAQSMREKLEEVVGWGEPEFVERVEGMLKASFLRWEVEEDE